MNDDTDADMDPMTELHTIERIGRKNRTRAMLSPELVGVIDQFEGDGRRSDTLERAAWEHLIDEYGVEAVLEAVDDVQESLAPSDRLDETKRVTVQV